MGRRGKAFTVKVEGFDDMIKGLKERQEIVRKLKRTEIEIGAYMKYSLILERGGVDARTGTQPYMEAALNTRFGQDVNLKIDNQDLRQKKEDQIKNLWGVQGISGKEAFMHHIAAEIQKIAEGEEVGSMPAMLVRAASPIVVRAQLLSPHLTGANRRSIHARGKPATVAQVDKVRARALKDKEEPNTEEE